MNESFPLLENLRVRLELLEHRHLTSLLPIALAQPDLLKYSPVPFGNEENLKRYIEKARQEYNAGSRFPFAVFDKRKQAFAGSSSFMIISEPSSVVEIGWTWIGPEFQGTGLNANMKFLMLEYLFEVKQMERVEFKTDSRNLASRKALEKLGATFEGVLREHMVMLDGYRRSSAYYSILKSEWPGLCARLSEQL